MFGSYGILINYVLPGFNIYLRIYRWPYMKPYKHKLNSCIGCLNVGILTSRKIKNCSIECDSLLEIQNVVCANIF